MVKPKKKFMPNIGGQAVIEGVMMRSPNFFSIAVRKPNKKIFIKTEKYISITKRIKLLSLPFFRGMVMLFEMLYLGVKSLSYSAEEAADQEKLSPLAIILTIFLSLFFGVLLFVLLPYFLTYLVGIKEEAHYFLFNLVDGIIKLALFIAYLLLISRMKDIKRVFQYHGAEHKAVNCYENALELTVKNAKKFTTIHKRCGTSFILIVIIVGIFLFSFLPFIAKNYIAGFNELSFALRRIILISARLLLLLPLAGISYELLKLSASRKNSLLNLLVMPGMFVQWLTTKEPTEKQIEVAIASLKAALKSESADKNSINNAVLGRP